MPSTEARIIDIREWRAARERVPRSSNAPLFIVVIVLVLAGLIGLAVPRGAAAPTIEPVQWDGWRP